MQISEPQTKPSAQTGFNHPLWQLAFRSFFLAGGLYSALSVGLWLLSLSGFINLSQEVLPSVIWHAHEMIFGFAALIAVGFILTAVQTWTGTPSITGLPVFLLLITWILVRVLLFINLQVTALVALALLLGWWCTVVTIYARIVWSANNKRNYLFVPLLSMLGILNVSTLALAIAGFQDVALHIARSAVLLFTMIMAVVGGRVIPFFTVRGAHVEPQEPLNWLEKILLPTSFIGISIFIAGQFVPLPITPAVFMILAGSLHLIRMTTWSSIHTLNVPLLWSLHLSYAFMGLGLIALGLSYSIDALTFSTALHIITLGAIGLMIISMMSRVSLGHTGRLLQVKPQIVIAFLLMIAATVLRFGLSIAGHPFEAWIASASLWVISFSIFFFTYWPVLSAPRQ
ncbi:NnrS family protein [Thalassotalea euphylliae]|uniref:NnrS family protein n=1 Tax=Thalassotalea euphylliae TaxID=1655234 RepID=UPI00362A37BA